MGRLLDRMSFWSGAEAIAIVFISFILYEKYIAKSPPEEGHGSGHIDSIWILAFMTMELTLQAALEPNLGMGEAIAGTIADTIGNIVIFFVCYGVLGIFGVSKESRIERLAKAFKGVIIITGLICIALLN